MGDGARARDASGRRDGQQATRDACAEAEVSDTSGQKLKRGIECGFTPVTCTAEGR